MTLVATERKQLIAQHAGWKLGRLLLPMSLLGGIWLFWIAWFVLGQVGFYFYNATLLELHGAPILGRIVWAGLALHGSMAGYLSLVPGVLLAAAQGGAGHLARVILRWYMCVLMGLTGAIVCADYEMFRAWGVHFHSHLLTYLQYPDEALASIGSSPWFLLILVYIGVLCIGIYIWLLLERRARQIFHKIKPYRLGAILVLCATSMLVFPIRGGVQLAPINQSAAYFSTHYHLNQAAVNPVWNLMQTVTEARGYNARRYTFMAKQQAVRMEEALEPATGQDVPAGWMGAHRPNVLLIVWESCTAKVMAELGGKAGITPNLSAIARDGVLFTSAYAVGDRSEKGLLALFTGYPAQTGSSAIIYPEVTAQFPHLSTAFSKAGYGTSFLYGGELEFANIKTMLINGKFDSLTGIEAFGEKERNSKWGAHDHVVLGRLQAQLAARPQPWFSSVFTLSSHEPFEVPGKRARAGASEQDLFVNSLRYTDSALGDFVRQAKETTWWDSTLVCIVADHGHRLPGPSALYMPAKFHIPLILTGGALRKRGRDERLLSQIDVGPMLLALSGLPAVGSYAFARNPLSASYTPRALYTFYEGLGMIRNRDTVVLNAQTGKTLRRYPGKPHRADTAKAMLQRIMEVMDR